MVLLLGPCKVTVGNTFIFRLCVASLFDPYFFGPTEIKNSDALLWFRSSSKWCSQSECKLKISASRGCFSRYLKHCVFSKDNADIQNINSVFQKLCCGYLKQKAQYTLFGWISCPEISKYTRFPDNLVTLLSFIHYILSLQKLKIVSVKSSKLLSKTFSLSVFHLRLFYLIIQYASSMMSVCCVC